MTIDEANERLNEEVVRLKAEWGKYLQEQITMRAGREEAKLKACEAERDQFQLNASQLRGSLKEVTMERDALAKRLAIRDICVVCQSSLGLPLDCPPHCEDCYPDEDATIDWNDALRELEAGNE